MDKCTDERCTGYQLTIHSFLLPKHELCVSCRLRYMTSDHELAALNGALVAKRGNAQLTGVIDELTQCIYIVGKEVNRRRERKRHSNPGGW